MLLSANDEQLWRRTGLLLLTATNKGSFDKLLRSMAHELGSDIVAVLGELYGTMDVNLIGRRRGRVLECLSEQRVFEKYPSDGLHDKKAGDVEVAINGMLQGPEKLDVCVWTTCDAHSGEFFECKAGDRRPNQLEGQLRLLDRIYNGLVSPGTGAGPVVGVISFNFTDAYVRGLIRRCKYQRHITAVGFGSLFSSFRRHRVCDCASRFAP